MTKKLPPIGELLPVSPLEQITSSEWRVQCSEVTPSCRCILKIRKDERQEFGEHFNAWVFGIDAPKKTIFFSTSEFGRKPISDRMRPRYLRAIECFLAILRHEPFDTTYFMDAISEVKGMFNRCLKKDQWDWLSVYITLGRPEAAILTKVTSTLTPLRRSVKDEDLMEANANLEKLRELGLEEVLSNALTRIKEATPSLDDSKPLTAKQLPASEDLEKKSEGKILSSFSKHKLSVANTIHNQTLNILAVHLEEHGHVLERNIYIDVFCRLKSGPAIFEVKSINEANELSQVRHAISQLYEYRYRHRIPETSLWLVLSRFPKQEWIVEYLLSDREINVLWTEDGKLAGPSLERLLESGSAARRRSEHHI